MHAHGRLAQGYLAPHFMVHYFWDTTLEYLNSHPDLISRLASYDEFPITLLL